MKERSDSDILRELRVHPDLLGVLYERHPPFVYRYLARRVDFGSAEDLLSEVFVAAMTGRMRVVPHESESALPWLYGIAGNVVRAHLRRRTNTALSQDTGPMDWDAVDARLDAQAKAPDLHAALASLSGVDRELLLLVAWEGLTPAEAGAALHISPVAARSRLHRARHRAQTALDARTRAS